MSDKFAYVIIVAISYHAMDLPNAFVCSLTVYASLGALSILKSLHHEARPFFVTELRPTFCLNEYGSPSGHAITSTSMYFTMWRLMCRHYRPGSLKYYLTFALVAVVVAAIAFSRLFNGVHTFNQLLHGFCLGLFLHFLFCDVLYDELIKFVYQVHTFTTCRVLLNKGTFIFFSIYAVAIFNFLYGEIIHPVPPEWNTYMEKNCVGVKWVKNSFEQYNFIQFNLAFTVVGTYIGLILEQKYLGTREYTEFHNTSVKLTITRLLAGFASFAPILSSIFLFPKRFHWSIVVLGRIVVPVGLGNFYLFGLSKWIFIKLGLANLKKSSDNEQFDELRSTLKLNIKEE